MRRRPHVACFVGTLLGSRLNLSSEVVDEITDLEVGWFRPNPMCKVRTNVAVAEATPKVQVGIDLVDCRKKNGGFAG